MDWVNDFSGRVIGLDTSPIIYFVEENVEYFEVIHPFFEELSSGKFRAVTSTITLLEVLVQPYRKKHTTLASQYKEILLNSQNLTVLPLLNETSDEAAKLRGKYNIRTPDAVQVATAIYGGASGFLTNDTKLRKIKEIEIIVLDDIIKKIQNNGN
jgi:predicted nucleic acid-binding protein